VPHRVGPRARILGACAKRSAPRNVWQRSGQTPGTERGGDRAADGIVRGSERVGSPGSGRAAAGEDYLDGARASC